MHKKYTIKQFLIEHMQEDGIFTCIHFFVWGAMSMLAYKEPTFDNIFWSSLIPVAYLVVYLINRHYYKAINENTEKSY